VTATVLESAGGPKSPSHCVETMYSHRSWPSHLKQKLLRWLGTLAQSVTVVTAGCEGH